VYLVNAQQMREIDRFAIEEIGIPGIVLMEHAGRAVVHEVEKRWPSAQVVILAGHGNNGGDGFVAARHLINKGYDVSTWLIGKKEKMTSDCLLAYQMLVNSQHSVKVFDGQEWDELAGDLQQATVIIDGMLGTGVSGELRQPIKTIIDLVNKSPGRKAAIDLPSGVDANLGTVSSVAIHADLTVTFAYPKWGQYLFPGAACCGEIVVADISIPKLAEKRQTLTDQLLSTTEMAKLLPRRPRHSHKGTFGHVLIIAGSISFLGAPAFCAMGAIRSGSGMVTLAVPKQVQQQIAGQVPEVVFWSWPDTDGHFTKDSWRLLADTTNRYDSIVIGPGVSKLPGREWLAQLIACTEGPLLLDADALNLLAEDLSIFKNRPNLILTPHPGEMARLLGVTTKEIELNRSQAARQFAVTHQVHVVLKGTYPIITTPRGEQYVSTRGSSSLAKGGSGDVLAGMIAAFVNQTRDVTKGTLLGVYLHGMAGEFMDEYSGCASDLKDVIGKAIYHLH
jgi:ADP-dependent NAD(P)H-hydrate dehydratase / NAD(P)H-hydrate epimerase